MSRTAKKAIKKHKRSPWTKAERVAWEIPDAVSVSDWAQKNRVIGSYSAEPGPWRNERAPYLVEIMDAYSDPEVEEISIGGPAQSGKTEAVFNMLAYSVDVDPGPMMYTTARDDDCDIISDDRLWPMFSKDCPALFRHLSGSKRDYNKGEKIKFDRMSLYFASAQSPADLAGKPISRVFLDEVDKYPKSVKDEGSPAKLAKRRTQTFGDSKAVYLCTPTTNLGYINKSFKRSNAAHRMVPCPECGEYIRLLFAQLKVDDPDLRDPDVIITKECVHYECQECGGKIPESKKNEMDLRGVWCPKGCTVSKTGKIYGKPDRIKRHSGFWIDGMLSPWIRWHDMLAEFFEITDSLDGVDVPALREFLNQVVGQVWKDRAREVAYKKLLTKRNEFLKGAVPVGCECLVASADYHKKDNGEMRLDFEVKGFAAGGRRYLITSGAVDSWEDLEEELILHPFPWAADDCEVEELAVSAVFIDSGDEPDDVYEFCREYPGICYPTKGRRNLRTPYTTIPVDEALAKAKNPKRKRRAGRYRGVLLIHIDTSFFKSLVTTAAERDMGETKSLEFYKTCPDQYFREFCNEHQVMKKSHGENRLIWEPVSEGAPCHSLDTAVGTEAAGYWKKVRFIGRDNSKKIAAATKQMMGKNKKDTKRVRPKKKSGFLGNIHKVEL